MGNNSHNAFRNTQQAWNAFRTVDHSLAKKEVKLDVSTKVFVPKKNVAYTVKNQSLNPQKFFDQTSRKLEEFSCLSPKSQINVLYRKNVDIEEDRTNDTSVISSTSNSRKSSGGEQSFKVKYKTEICKYWQVNKTCKFGDNCAFAHGGVEVRQRTHTSNSYKTKPCKQFFDFGFCLYGSRCQFLHSEFNKTTTQQSFKDLLKNFDGKNEVNRLRIFEKVSNVYSRKSSEDSYESNEM